MFENIIKEIQRLQAQKVSVPIHADKDGYVDKECPHDNCGFQFKVHDGTIGS